MKPKSTAENWAAFREVAKKNLFMQTKNQIQINKITETEKLCEKQKKCLLKKEKTTIAINSRQQPQFSAQTRWHRCYIINATKI